MSPRREGVVSQRIYEDVSMNRNTVKQNNVQKEKTVSSDSLQKNLTRLGCQNWISPSRGKLQHEYSSSTIVSRPS